MNAIDFESLRVFALSLAAFGQTVFVLMYVLWPWWSDFLGRSLFFKSLGIMLLLNFSLLFRGVEWRYEDVFFTALYFVFAIGVWVQVGAFLRVKYRKPIAAWLEKRRNRKKADS